MSARILPFGFSSERVAAVAGLQRLDVVRDLALEELDGVGSATSQDRAPRIDQRDALPHRAVLQLQVGCRLRRHLPTDSNGGWL